MSLFDRFDVVSEAKRIAEVARVAGGGDDSKKTYSDKEIEKLIENGGAVVVWSSVLNERVRWVKDQSVAAKFPISRDGIATYMLPELGEIVKQAWPAEHLRRIHLFKKELDCSIVPEVETQIAKAPPATFATPATFKTSERLTPLLDKVYEFLKDRVEFPALKTPPEVLTYICEAEQLFQRYRAWDFKARDSFDRDDFTSVIHILFPHAKLHRGVQRHRKIERNGVICDVQESVDEWSGFRVVY